MDDLLLETGDHFLLETGDLLLLEAGGAPPPTGNPWNYYAQQM